MESSLVLRKKRRWIADIDGMARGERIRVVYYKIR
jgi:hypothetical protein